MALVGPPLVRIVLSLAPDTTKRETVSCIGAGFLAPRAPLTQRGWQRQRLIVGACRVGANVHCEAFKEPKKLSSESLATSGHACPVLGLAPLCADAPTLRFAVPWSAPGSGAVVHHLKNAASIFQVQLFRFLQQRQQTLLRFVPQGAEVWKLRHLLEKTLCSFELLANGSHAADPILSQKATISRILSPKVWLRQENAILSAAKFSDETSNRTYKSPVTHL